MVHDYTTGVLAGWSQRADVVRPYDDVLDFVAFARRS